MSLEKEFEGAAGAILRWISFEGVANGKIRDSPRRRDPYLKIRDRDLEALTKSEPETLYQENRARDFILRKSEPVSKSVGSET